MKNEFIGYYSPTDKEIKDTWTNGVFAFDANTLLNLYRYTESTRNDFLNALKSIKGKLFIPYQAALEYHNNRLSVIDGIEYSYSVIYELFENNFKKHIESQILQFKKHPAINVDGLLQIHSDFLKKIGKELEKQKEKHPDFKTADNVLEGLTELFENALGQDFSRTELKKIYEEGKLRYEENIPPGYKDLDNKRKKGDRHIYGDLIIWKELITFTKKENKPLIFVTDDRKEDWWTIENGKTIRPREELIKEFYDLTGIRILIYNADNFLYYAKKKQLVPKIKEDTLKEVKEIRVSDEKTYASLNDLANYTITNPKSLSELINEVTIQRPKTLSELISEGRPKSLSELINEGRPKSLSELINEGTIQKPKTLSELINEERPKSLSELISEGTIQRPKTLSELINEGLIKKPKTLNELINDSNLSKTNVAEKKAEKEQNKLSLKKQPKKGK